MFEALINPETEVDLLIEDILLFKIEKNLDFSILDLVIEYCEEKELDITEIGEILSESKEFKELLEKELITLNFFKSNKKIKRQPDIILEDW
jgi:hypothetical protein